MQKLNGSKLREIWEAGRMKGTGPQAGKLVEFFPWDREAPPKKAIGSLPRKPRSGRKVRSRPATPGQEHLEIYLGSMEKTRMARLGKVFGRLLGETAENWETADKKIRETQGRLEAIKRRGRGEGQ